MLYSIYLITSTFLSCGNAGEGYTIIFKLKTQESDNIQGKSEFIEIFDQNGTSVYRNEDIFIASLGSGG